MKFILSDKNYVNNFWIWFDSISDSLFDDIKNIEIVSELELMIKKLGPFDWEIGPINGDLRYLAISPNLDEDLLIATSEIISHAPKNPKWLFFDAKPQKEYNPLFSMLNENGAKILIDTSLWKYQLYQFGDGTFDMDLNIKKINGNINVKKTASDIALTNILGEKKFIKLIKNIQIIETDTIGINKMSSFQYLDKNITKIIGNVIEM